MTLFGHDVDGGFACAPGCTSQLPHRRLVSAKASFCHDDRCGSGRLPPPCGSTTVGGLSDGHEFHSSDRRLEVDYRASPRFRPQRHKRNPSNGLLNPLINKVYMAWLYIGYIAHK